MADISTTDQADLLLLTNDAWTSPHFISSAKKLSLLEKKVSLEPKNLTARAQLLGYYTWTYCDFDDHRKQIDLTFADQRRNNIIWFLENIPDSKFAGSFMMYVNKTKDPANYAKVKEAWIRQIAEQPTKAVIAINAATFLSKWDNPEAKAIVESALKHEPQNVSLLSMLAVLNGKKQKLLIEDKPQSKILSKTAKATHIKRLTQEANRLDLTGHVLEGCELLPAEASELESILLQHPNDLKARAKLLGYTFKRNLGCNYLLRFDPVLFPARLRHIRWVVENIPGAKFSGTPFAYDFERESAPKQFAKIKALWYEQMAAFPNDKQIPMNISCFLTHSNIQEAERLIHELLKSHPNDLKLQQRLLHLQRLQSYRSSDR